MQKINLLPFDPSGKKGVFYFIPDEMLQDYRKWSMVEKFAWLEDAQQLTAQLSDDRTRCIRDQFRAGEI